MKRTLAQGTSELTKLASSELKHEELKVMGFNLTIDTRLERGATRAAGLELSTWMDGSIGKADFIKRG